jgi:hypothetical protein
LIARGCDERRREHLERRLGIDPASSEHLERLLKRHEPRDDEEVPGELRRRTCADRLAEIEDALGLSFEELGPAVQSVSVRATACAGPPKILLS